MMKSNQFFSYVRGSLCIERVPLGKIAGSVGTPFYAYSAAYMKDAFARLSRVMAPAPHLICYAVKANSNLRVLKLLGDQGAGMDIVSGGELYKVGRIGVQPKHVVFSGVGKTAREIREALACRGKGVRLFNVESDGELELINRVAGGLGVVAEISLRFNPDVVTQTHEYISTGKRENKFGIPGREILSMVRRLPRLKNGRLSGVSLHIGSQLCSLAPFEKAFKKTETLIREIQVRTGTPLATVDVGGGLGVRYKNEKPVPLSSYANLIKHYFFKNPRLGGHAPLIILEPGRYLVANAGALISRVLYKKNHGRSHFIIIDAAMNDLIRPALYQSYHEVLPVQKARLRSRLKKSRVVGPVCETGDFLADQRPLPQSLAPHDLVAIMSSGAYGFSMSSQYNSRPRPTEVLVTGARFAVIRKRDHYSDLL